MVKERGKDMGNTGARAYKPALAPAPGDGTTGIQDMPEDDVSQLSFEDALTELDQIVRGLEGGTLKLDAAVQAFERGVRLRRHCEAKLAEVEARVEALVQRSDGSLTTRPLA